MRLSLPFVLGIDELVEENPIQRIAVPAQDVEGVLSGFTRDRIKGWLFQPNDGSSSVLIVPPKTKSDRIPATYTHVLTGTVADVTAEGVDLSLASWTRHPQLADGRARDHAQEHQAILDSWRGGFSYVEENEAAKVVGLRPPQIGAVHAVHAHWAITDGTATIVMPTGIGKTETMLSILVSACCHRVLVIVPTDALRSQLARKFLTLGVLKHPKARILGDGVLPPSVCILRHIPTTPAEVEELFARSNPSPAAADWLLTPSVGGALFDITDTGTRPVIGGSVAWMGPVAGFELDLSDVPTFLESRPGLMVDSSNLFTLMGNAVVQFPTTSRRIRPYAVGGIGVIHSRVKTLGDPQEIKDEHFGFNVGGGLTALLNERVGLRGDFRYFRGIRNDDATPVADALEVSELKFLRFTIGATFRF